MRTFTYCCLGMGAFWTIRSDLLPAILKPVKLGFQNILIFVLSLGNFEAEFLAKIAHQKHCCSYYSNERPRKIRDIKVFILLKFAEIRKPISFHEK